MVIDIPLLAARSKCSWHFEHGENLGPEELASLFAALAECATNIRNIPFEITVNFRPAGTPLFSVHYAEERS